MVSWDTNLNTYDTNETDGRSFISCISEVITDANETCDGAAKNDMGECRMDIVSSEMGYLGYYDSESYGLTWKVMMRHSQRVHMCLLWSERRPHVVRQPPKCLRSSPLDWS